MLALFISKVYNNAREAQRKSKRGKASNRTFFCDGCTVQHCIADGAEVNLQQQLVIVADGILLFCQYVSCFDIFISNSHLNNNNVMYGSNKVEKYSNDVTTLSLPTTSISRLHTF